MSLEINPVAAQLSPALGGTSGGLSTAGQKAQVFDVAAWRETMATQANMANPVDAAVQGNGLAPASVTESEAFRTVMTALESLNGDVQRLNAQAQPFTDGSSEMSPGDMLALTVRCHQFLFHCQLTSNVANRTSEGVQQLFRQQS